MRQVSVRIDTTFPTREYTSSEICRRLHFLKNKRVEAPWPISYAVTTATSLLVRHLVGVLAASLPLELRACARVHLRCTRLSPVRIDTEGHHSNASTGLGSRAKTGKM